MRRPNSIQSRNLILRDLWLKHGCPEKMTVRVRKTAETIVLINGLCVTDSAEKSPLLMMPSKAQNRGSRVMQPVTDNRRCEVCQVAFTPVRKDARYCSPRCRQKAVRQKVAEQLRREAEQLLTSIDSNPRPTGT